MQRVSKLSVVALSAIGLFVTSSASVLAQSGSRSYPSRSSAIRPKPAAGSGTVSAKAPLALEGYCPVSILEMKKWVKGDSRFTSVRDGKTYVFASEKGKKMFDANPAKYIPALGGDCVVALKKMGKRVPGDIRHAAFHKGRLYLFSNEQGQKMFLDNPTEYTNVDLALNGECPVCLMKMHQRVAGKPDIAAYHNGLRYLFPADEQRQMFLAHPEQFVSATTSKTAGGSGSSSR